MATFGDIGKFEVELAFVRLGSHHLDKLPSLLVRHDLVAAPVSVPFSPYPRGIAVAPGIANAYILDGLFVLTLGITVLLAPGTAIGDAVLSRLAAFTEY